MITLSQIKGWVAVKATVQNPYGRYWTAATTIGGRDIYEEGETIEEAYQKLSLQIHNSSHLANSLENMQSFKLLNPS